MKIKGFGDYNFSRKELKAAKLPDGGYDAFYLFGLAMWPAFKMEMIARGEVPFEDMIKAKS